MKRFSLAVLWIFGALVMFPSPRTIADHFDDVDRQLSRIREAGL